MRGRPARAPARAGARGRRHRPTGRAPRSPPTTRCHTDRSVSSPIASAKCRKSTLVAPSASTAAHRSSTRPYRSIGDRSVCAAGRERGPKLRRVPHPVEARAFGVDEQPVDLLDHRDVDGVTFDQHTLDGGDTVHGDGEDDRDDPTRRRQVVEVLVALAEVAGVAEPLLGQAGSCRRRSTRSTSTTGNPPWKIQLSIMRRTGSPVACSIASQRSVVSVFSN